MTHSDHVGEIVFGGLEPRRPLGEAEGSSVAVPGRARPGDDVHRGKEQSLGILAIAIDEREGLAPQRLVDRLRAARSDAVKQEAWVLAGAGRVREAAQVELVEAPR